MNIRGLSLVVCLGAAWSAAWGQQYTITTLAGTGSAGFAGDNGAPSAAQLNSPRGLALDSKGNLYIADSTNHRVRMISGGTITTVAGTGTAGYNGDKVAPTSAALNNPSGLAFDASGNLYIADSGNNLIRKISNGIITTVAGDAGQLAGESGDGGQATSATLSGPTAVALDSSGNLYIADSGNNLIRKVDTNGIITQYLGFGTATQGRIRNPNGLALTGNTLYIADSNENRIAKYSPITVLNSALSFSNFAGNLTAGFAGDGNPATLAQLNNPVGIAVDSAGALYIADSNNRRIRKVATDGTISTIAGRDIAGYSGDGGPATSASLNFPRGVVVASNGVVYIADTSNHVIRALSPGVPVISANGVGNAASFVPPISPGALATVVGTGFGASTVQPSTLPLPASVAGVSVTVNGKAAPIFYLSPTQINFQVPWSTPATGTVNVAVIVGNVSSNTVSMPAATAAPGLFVANGAAIVQNFPDFSLNDAGNPAKAGSAVIAYLTGSGPVSQPIGDGAGTPASGFWLVTSLTSAKIGSVAAKVDFAGLTPNFVGLTQMNIIIPSTLAPGVYPLTVTIDGQTSNSGTIAVK